MLRGAFVVRVGVSLAVKLSASERAAVINLARASLNAALSLADLGAEVCRDVASLAVAASLKLRAKATTRARVSLKACVSLGALISASARITASLKETVSLINRLT